MGLKHLVVGVAVVIVMVSGCGKQPRSATEIGESYHESDEWSAIVTDLTWEEAKGRAQSMMLEIAGRFPGDAVIETEQRETGTLLSCADDGHNWNGSTRVILKNGFEAESLVRSVADQYRAEGYRVSEYLDDGVFTAQLGFDDGQESYIFGQWLAPNEIKIDAGSPCFRLPDDVWPGGTF